MAGEREVQAGGLLNFSVLRLSLYMNKFVWTVGADGGWATRIPQTGSRAIW